MSNNPGDRTLDDKADSQPRNQTQNSLFHIDDNRLSVLTTTADIARILLKEATGITGVSMHAAYHLANMHLSLKDKPSDTDLSDLVEFIIILGNSSTLVTPSNIDSYISMKNEIRRTHKKSLPGMDPMSTRPNKRFHDLLANTMVGEPIGKENVVVSGELEERRYALLQDIVHELSSIYRLIISGDTRINQPQGAKQQDASARSSQIPLRYIPDEYLTAAKVMLVNFPILTRLEILTYQDIMAGVKLDTLLPKLPQQYSTQIRNMIEMRVREIAEQMTDSASDLDGILAEEIVNVGTDDVKTAELEVKRERLLQSLPHRLPAADVLYHARVAYLATNGIEASMPRISRKHIISQDYQTALLSAISRLTGKKEEIVDERQQRRETNAWIYYRMPGAFQDKQLYMEQNRVDMSDDDDRNSFTSNSDKTNYCRRIVEAAGDRLGSTDREILEFMLNNTSGKHKYQMDDLPKILDALWGSIVNLDPIAWMMLARTSGLTSFYNTADEGKDDEGERDDDEKGDDAQAQSQTRQSKKSVEQIYAIGISALTLSDGMERELTAKHSWRRNSGKAPDAAIWTSDNTTFTRVDDFDRLAYSMIATYVHNQQLMKIPNHINEMDQYEWNSPLIFRASYSPQDLHLASALMKRYPIFSRMMVRSPEDISNGIVLSMLQRITGDSNLDESATISQNLFIRQLHSMNILAEKNIQYSRDGGRR